MALAILGGGFFFKREKKTHLKKTKKKQRCGFVSGGMRGVSDEACRNAHKTDVLTDNACVKRTALIFRMSPGHVFFFYIYMRLCWGRVLFSVHALK